MKNVISKEREPAPDVISKERERLRNPKIPHYIWDMDFSLRKISHPAHAGIRNDRKEGQNDKNGGYSKVSYDKNERDVLITRAHIVHGYTLEEIADFLHFHYVAVSMAIKRIGTDNV